MLVIWKPAFCHIFQCLCLLGVNQKMVAVLSSVWQLRKSPFRFAELGKNARGAWNPFLMHQRPDMAQHMKVPAEEIGLPKSFFRPLAQFCHDETSIHDAFNSATGPNDSSIWCERLEDSLVSGIWNESKELICLCLLYWNGLRKHWLVLTQSIQSLALFCLQPCN